MSAPASMHDRTQTAAAAIGAAYALLWQIGQALDDDNAPEHETAAPAATGTAEVEAR